MSNVSLSFEKFSQRLGHHIPPGQKFNLVKLSSQNFLQKLKGTISHIIWISFLCKQISTINREASWPNVSSVILPLNISGFLRQIKKGEEWGSQPYWVALCHHLPHPESSMMLVGLVWRNLRASHRNLHQELLSLSLTSPLTPTSLACSD